MNLDEAKRVVQEKWKSARIIAGGNDVAIAGANPRASVYAVFVGAFNLRGGNGPRRRSGWFLSEEDAWQNAAGRIQREAEHE